MKLLIKIAVIVLSIAYPFAVYWGLQHYDALVLLPLLLILLGLRWLSGGQLFERNLAIITFVLVIIIAIIWSKSLSLKFYPVMMNYGFLLVFASSLFSASTIVERFARLQEPDLSPRFIAYTRKVTWAWSLFFLVNGSIAAITAIWASNEMWTLYNGFIAYVLIGMLAGGEWLIRQRVKRMS
ncbi:MAG: putative membrane protein [Gammaproteobacteria bacterium]|jgi:uncharacterized membrane protein